MPIAKPAWPILQRGDPLARGLVWSFPMVSPNWGDIVRNQAVAATSGLTLSGSPVGAGGKTAGGAEYASVSYGAQPPTVWSMEALVYLKTTTSGFICGWNQSSDGSNVTFDRQLYVTDFGAFGAHLYDGFSKTATGGTAVAGSLVHICATSDGTLLLLYVNGALVATTVVSNGGFTAYGLPVYFVCGASGPSGILQGPVHAAIDGTLLLVNFANVVWTAAEIAQKAIDPFSIYRPKRRVPWFTVAGGVITPVNSPVGWFDPEFTNRGWFDPLMASTNLGLFDEEQGNNITGLGPSLFSDVDTFFTPTVATTLSNLTPAFFVDADTFSTQLVSLVPYPLFPSLFSDADTFYVPVATSRITITPGFYSDSDSFFTQTITPGSVSITPSFYSDADSFFTQVVAPAPYNLQPAFYTDADSFFTQIVSQGGITILPSLYSDADSFFTQSIAPGPVVLQPALYSDVDTFNTQVVSSVYALQPAFYNDADSFFTQVVVATYTLTPALYSDADTFNTQIVGLLPYNLVPSVYNDADSYYSPLVSQGGIVLAPNTYSDADNFFSPSIATFNTINPAFYSDADSFYTQVVGSVNSITPQIYVDGDTFYQQVITAGVVNLLASLFSDVDTFYQPVVLSINNLLPETFLDSDVFYSPAIIVPQNLAPGFYSDPEVFYEATLSFSIQGLFPQFFQDPDNFYPHMIYGGDVPRTIIVAPANRTVVSIGDGRTIVIARPRRVL
jgi:hypothetical protein